MDQRNTLGKTGASKFSIGQRLTALEYVRIFAAAIHLIQHRWEWYAPQYIIRPANHQYQPAQVSLTSMLTLACKCPKTMPKNFS